MNPIWLFIFEEWCKNVPSKRNKHKNYFLLFFCWRLVGHWQKEQHPDPDPQITSTEPRLRIRAEMSRIPNTARNCVVIGGSASHEAYRDPTFYIDADPDTDMLLTKVMSFRIRNPDLYTGRGVPYRKPYICMAYTFLKLRRTFFWDCIHHLQIQDTPFCATDVFTEPQ